MNRGLSPEDAALKLFDIYADKVYEFAGDRAVNEDTLVEVEGILRTLPYEQRQIVYLRFIEDLSTE